MLIQIFLPSGPSLSTIRCFISSAALLVNVKQRMFLGSTLFSCTRRIARSVRTRVLPDPGGAVTTQGPR